MTEPSCLRAFAIHCSSEKAQVTDTWHTADISRLLLLPDLFTFILESGCLPCNIFQAWKQAAI